MIRSVDPQHTTKELAIMKAFMDKDFLLSTETSKKLFHEYAETMPIVDYHCHINPQEIAEDRKFENITQVWLGGDHYKWRQMRSNGVDEYYITGGASDREKFQKCLSSALLLFRNLHQNCFIRFLENTKCRTIGKEST